MLNSHMGLVATMLNRADAEHFRSSESAMVGVSFTRNTVQIS